MACNCGQTPCTQLPTCTCPVKDLRTDCSIYSGPNLECSGIESGTILTTLIQRLDAFICTTRDEIYEYIVQVTTLINIGGGAEVFKQANGLGNKELRTIVSEDTTHLDVVQNTDTIGIRGGVHRLELDSGTDILSLIVNTLSGDTALTDIDLSEYNYDTFVQSASFDSGTQVLTIVRNNGESDINVDLSFLGNHLESVNYNSGTNNLEFNLTDATQLTVNISTILADAQVQSDYLESNSSDPAFIVNKNPSKTVVLGVAGNYDVVDADNNYIIEIDNGANDVTINFATITATTEFFVGFVQKGTGLVTFNGADIVPQDLLNQLYGQGHVASVEIIAATKYLGGTLKAS